MTFKNDHAQEFNFLNYPSVQKLKKLAEHSIDLSQPNQLTAERIEKYYAEACGFRLLYGTEKVTDEVMENLAQLAKESNAIDKMAKMQDGEVVNFIGNYPSEHRPALHTATRDLFNHPNSAPKAQEAALLARHELEKLKSFMAKIDVEHQFNELVVIGIGGSYLGPLANYIALEYLKIPHRQVHFISNVDPDDATLVLNKVNLKHTLILVISKSGTTLETRTNEEFVRDCLKSQHLNPKNHFICVTCPGTPMDNHDHYLQVFYMWDWIGGRFSTTSMVGATVLAFAFGWDVLVEFLHGAHEMDKAALNPDIKHNLPLLAALLGIWNRSFLHYSTVALIPYSRALARYPAHIQQVAMESNGKSIDKHGKSVSFQTSPVIWGEPGTDAQHSFFQMLHQGTDVIPVSLIGFRKSQFGKDYQIEGTTSQEKVLANLFAQSLALAMGQKSDNPNKMFKGNRPSHILLGEKLTPFALGALLAFYEHLVVFQGFIWNVNSFDQEGVQLGKVLSNRLIQLFSNRREKIKEPVNYPLGEAFFKHLDYGKSNNHHK